MLKVTLKQIAEQSGVSISTVSKVINGSNIKSASPDTVEKILRIAKSLGYHCASSGNDTSVHRIGVILCSYIANKYTHTYYAKLYRCLEDEIHKHNCIIDFYYSITELLNSSFIKSEIMSSSADALILIDGFRNFPAPEIKEHFKYTLDISLQDSEDPPNDTIVMEVYQATRKIIRKFIDSGRTNIFFTSGDESIELNQQKKHDGSGIYFDPRTQAYVDELVIHNVPVDDKLFCFSEHWDSMNAYNQLTKLLKSGEKIDAIFASDDRLSIACYKALIDCNIAIPQDVALVGFDDVPDNFLADHKISSISVPKDRIAQTAVELLIARMQHCFAHPLKVSIPIHFISRDTF